MIKREDRKGKCMKGSEVINKVCELFYNNDREEMGKCFKCSINFLIIIIIITTSILSLYYS